jgi:hypothetical protein
MLGPEWVRRTFIFHESKIRLSCKDFHIDQNHHVYELIINKHKTHLTKHLKANNKLRQFFSIPLSISCKLIQCDEQKIKHPWTYPDELAGSIHIINRGTYENPDPVWDTGVHLTVNNTLQFCLKIMTLKKCHLNIIFDYKSVSQVVNYLKKNNTSELKIG